MHCFILTSSNSFKGQTKLNPVFSVVIVIYQGSIYTGRATFFTLQEITKGQN